MAEKRVIVTGGAGFIGSYVTSLLIEKGYSVTVFDNLSTGKLENIHPKATFVEGDINDTDLLKTIIKEGDTIFHLAACVSVQTTVEKPYDSFKENVLGFASVLEAARVNNARGIILSSSAAVYGNQEGTQKETMTPSPNTPYGLHKLQDEELGKLYSSLYNLPVIALRYFNVYGKGHHESGSYAPVIARFLKNKREGKSFPIIGEGNQTRDFIHVEDVALANYLAAQKIEHISFEICNICSGKEYSVLEIANLIDKNHHREFLPPRIEIQKSCGDTRHTQEILSFSATKKLEEELPLLF